MITPPITKDDIGRKFRCRNGMTAVIDKPSTTGFFWVLVSNGQKCIVNEYGLQFNGAEFPFELMEAL